MVIVLPFIFQRSGDTCPKCAVFGLFELRLGPVDVALGLMDVDFFLWFVCLNRRVNDSWTESDHKEQDLYRFSADKRMLHFDSPLIGRIERTVRLFLTIG